MDMAIQRAQEANSIAAELDLQAGPAWGVLVELASMFGFLGDLGRVAEHAERAIATVDPSIPARVEYPRVVLATLHLQQGQRAAAEALLALSAPRSFDVYLETVVTGFASLPMLAAHAELALAQSDPARALMLMDDVIESAGRMGLWIVLPPAFHIKARGLWALGPRG